MGALAELYSYIDTMKRKGRAFAQDPGGTIDQGVRNFGEDQDKILGLADLAYPRPGQRSVLVSPQERDSARTKLADYAAQMGLGAVAGATVWHGSPHKFNKFDFSKIGTGEGAQAYGHGGYLAGNVDVAMKYQPRDLKFEASVLKRYNAAAARENFPEMEVYENYLLQRSPSEVATSIVGSGYKGADAAAQQAAHKWATKQYQQQAGSHLYKVDLPDEQIAKMLDWDKPMGQQSKSVQDSFKQLSQKLSKDELAEMTRPHPGFKPGGENLYFGLSNAVGGDNASRLMREAGIPGIRYLDQVSRTGGVGTSNYVVFPGGESMLRILSRNNQAMP